LKINPRYCYIFLGQRIRPPNNIRSKEKGLKILYDLEKWNTPVFPCSTISPLSTKERIEMRIF